MRVNSERSGIKVFRCINRSLAVFADAVSGEVAFAVAGFAGVDFDAR